MPPFECSHFRVFGGIPVCSARPLQCPLAGSSIVTQSGVSPCVRVPRSPSSLIPSLSSERGASVVVIRPSLLQVMGSGPPQTSRSSCPRRRLTEGSSAAGTRGGCGRDAPPLRVGRESLRVRKKHPYFSRGFRVFLLIFTHLTSIPCGRGN